MRYAILVGGLMGALALSGLLQVFAISMWSRLPSGDKVMEWLHATAVAGGEFRWKTLVSSCELMHGMVSAVASAGWDATCNCVHALWGLSPSSQELSAWIFLIRSSAQCFGPLSQQIYAALSSIDLKMSSTDLGPTAGLSMWGLLLGASPDGAQRWNP